MEKEIQVERPQISIDLQRKVLMVGFEKSLKLDNHLVDADIGPPESNGSKILNLQYKWTGNENESPVFDDEDQVSTMLGPHIETYVNIRGYDHYLSLIGNMEEPQVFRR